MWASSEVWPVGVSVKMFSGESDYAFYIKPLFNLVLFFINDVAVFLKASPMDVARFFFAFNFCLIIFLFSLILNRLTIKTSKWSIFFFLFLLCFNTYALSRGFRIRSDLLALTPYLGVLLLYTSSSRAKLFFLEMFLLVILIGFLITPKSIYFAIILTPLFYKKLSENFKARANRFVFKVAIVAFLAICILIYFYRKEPFLLSLISNPLTYFVDGFSLEEAGLKYLSIASFIYVKNLFVDNIFLTITLLAATYAAIKSFILKNDKQGASLSFIFWLAILFLHPNKFPFFIIAMLPLGLVLAFVLIKEEFDKRSLVMIVSFVSLSMFVSLHEFVPRILFIHWVHTNAEQRKAVDYVNKEFSKHKVKLIYDPDAIFRGPNAKHWFLGPGQSKTNRSTVKYMMSQNPDVMLLSLRFFHVRREVSLYLKENYLCNHSGVCLRSQNYSVDKNCQSDLFKKRSSHKKMDSEEVFIVNKKKGYFLNVTGWDKEKISKECPAWATSLKVTPFALSEPTFSGNMSSLFRFDFEI